MPLGKIVNFGSGKVHVFSDFDGTYCPAKHSSLHNPEANKHMPEYVRRIGDFFKTTNGDVHFHVTTGRTYGEYNAVSWLLKMRGLQLPFPESFIAKNGSDEYLKTGTDEAFYRDGVFPFSYSKTSQAKEDLIRQETNWDGVKIKAKINELAKKYHIRLVEADSENSVFDYGERSLFSRGKLNADDWKRMPQKDGKFVDHSPLVDYAIGSRNDGNLKVHLIFPPDYGICKERTGLYDGFKNELEAYLKSSNVKYSMKWDVPSHKNHYRNAVKITPLIDGDSLTKLFDTKLSVKNAKVANDLVIVAGDGSNDFKMLNPLEYLDKKFIAECASKSKYGQFYQNPARMISDLEAIFNGIQDGYHLGLKEELTSNGFLKKLQELPLCSIVIKKTNSSLDDLVEAFSSIGKVIEVEAGKIDAGIRLAIERYSKANEAFRKAMSENLKSFIFGIQKKNSGEVNKTVTTVAETITDSAKAGNKQTKMAFGVIGGLLILVGGVYAYLKSREEKENADN